MAWIGRKDKSIMEDKIKCKTSMLVPNYALLFLDEAFLMTMTYRHLLRST